MTSTHVLLPLLRRQRQRQHHQTSPSQFPSTSPWSCPPSPSSPSFLTLSPPSSLAAPPPSLSPVQSFCAPPSPSTASARPGFALHPSRPLPAARHRLDRSWRMQMHDLT